MDIYDGKRWNAHSQCGEDGILADLLDRIGDGKRLSIEFGAGNGIDLSNTAALVECRNYRAIMIEGDQARHAACAARWAGVEAVTSVRAMVSWGDDSLGAVLDRANCAPGDWQDVSVLSIDIDGADIHAWEAIPAGPRIVVIEYNPTVPDGVAFYQSRDLAVAQGASLDALAQYAERRGYELAAATPLNAIFVRADLFPALGIADNSPAALRPDRRHVAYVWHGYDGQTFVCGCTTPPWHGVAIDPEAWQLLPLHLRAFPDRYTDGQRAALAALRSQR